MSRGSRAVTIGAAALALVAIGVLAFIVIGRGQGNTAQFAGSGRAVSGTVTTPADWVFDRDSNPARTSIRLTLISLVASVSITLI